ncbi:RNA-binding S4 domain-containing protein [Alteribacter aurantiacus]|uniref:RNA-binding S4 domain-containing protein n=1 Tax=Alteribacter aurantiacus TaxID=254410 RepID=UPI00040BE80E|nr:RNA-binding S4 domain-containing protein [Alteribacter aurantiacus]
MRIDKYLKVSRLIKRRTMAKEVAEQGRITVNGQTVKAGANVKVGDEISIRFGQKIVTVTVDRLEESTRKDEAATLYTLVKEESLRDEQSDF